jgi:cysteine synthase A
LPLPGFAAARIDLYLKDESTHPTGSLKQPLTAVSELRAFRG